jgi:hypothetical protein
MLTAWQISEEDWLQTPASVRVALVTLDRHVLKLDARCAIYLRQVERLQAEVAAVLRQNLISTQNASHWSHITPVNMLYPVLPSY